MNSIAFLLRQGFVLLALCLWLLPFAQARDALLLDAGQAVVDAWPAVTLLPEQGERLTPAQALAGDFQPPQSPRANLGRRSEAVWLRLPLLARDDGRWVLQIDFAALDQVDAWLLADGRVLAQAQMGDHVPLAERAEDSLAPAWTLQLQPGVPHELLMRVQSSSPLVLPLRLLKPAAFGRMQDERLLIQGMLAGLGVALALYALMQWVTTRDAMFGWYALACVTGALFHLGFHGVASRHLWPFLPPPWVDQPLVLTGLVAAAAASMVADLLLDLRSTHARLSRMLRASAAVSLVLALAVPLGLVSLTQGQALGAALVLLPAALSLPLAWQRWRGGDRAALYLLVGWAAMLLGVLPMVMLLRGWTEAGFWALHGPQLGRVLTMLAWLRMLALRIEDVRRRAERAEHEHRQLHVLAHADALTGLPNRRGLDGALQGALQRVTPERRLALFVGDLDGFKPVNDRLGHEAGDELLVEAARRLRAKVRRGDVVARLGGDEFVIVAESLVTEEDARHLGRVLVDAFAEPFVLRGEHVRVGLTLGFAMTPADGLEAADLLRRADEAMYAGKRAGKSRLVHCEPLPAA